MALFEKRVVQEAFNRAAFTYDSVGGLSREVGDRMLECLDLIRLQPGTLLDLGAGTGYSTALLKKRYPRSEMIVVDFAEQMLFQNRNSLRRHGNYICANAENLPLTNNSVDLVFSNLMLPWCVNIDLVFSEINRVLKPEGILLFSTVGPDTLQQLRISWASVDDMLHVHSFYDLHDIGDALVRAKFADPVLDMELLTINYNEIGQLFRDLRLSGANNVLAERRKTLTGRQRFDQFVEYYETYRDVDGHLPATYEIIYGHAWSKTQNRGEVSIPVSAIHR